jgi:hypothetical protein
MLTVTAIVDRSLKQNFLRRTFMLLTEPHSFGG